MMTVIMIIVKCPDFQGFSKGHLFLGLKKKHKWKNQNEEGRGKV